MTLQGATRFIERPEATDRVLRAIDDLDETARAIRATIFGLHPRESGPAASGLRARLVDVVDRAAHSLGFTPTLQMTGLLDATVPAEIADAAVAVLEDALSNATRYARANAVTATLTADTDLSITVTDWVGLPEGGRRSALANLPRPDRCSGRHLRARTLPERGTQLVWQVPLPND
ncbi:hypothetical protein [Kitasatospora sp. NPDC096204]|uniref:hypothetical protein n=1 Tax=Kitasatospora sp. NPDC096204 TaxID=3364094 RepID=UPI00381A1FD8